MACGDSLYDFSVYLGFNISEGSDQLVSSPSMVEALCRSVQPKFLQSARRHSTRSRCSSPPRFPALVKLQPSGIDTAGTSVEKLPSLNSHIKKHTTEQTSTATAPCGGLTNIKPRMFGLPGNTGKALDKDTLQEDVDSLLGDSRSQQSVPLSQLCPNNRRLSAYKPQNSPHVRPLGSMRESLNVAVLKYVPQYSVRTNTVRASQPKVKGVLKQPSHLVNSRGMRAAAPVDVMSEVFGTKPRSRSPKKVSFSESVRLIWFEVEKD